MFKKGDKLICIDDSNPDPFGQSVKLGKMYTFLRYENNFNQEKVAILKEYEFDNYTPFAWRFKLANSALIKERLNIK